MSDAVGIIGGSALANVLALEDARSVRAKTPYGRGSSPVTHGRLAGRDVCLMMRQGIENQILPHLVNYRANISALAEMGCTTIVGVASVGAITKGVQTGRILVPHQIIDYTWGRYHTFADHADGGELNHIAFTEPFDDTVRQALIDGSTNAGPGAIDGGVHGVTQGPRLDTAAEVERFAGDGCDILDMNCMPEAALARELNIGYGCLAIAVNRAAGRQGQDVRAPDEIQHELAQVANVTQTILRSAVTKL